MSQNNALPSDNQATEHERPTVDYSAVKDPSLSSGVFVTQIDHDGENQSNLLKIVEESGANIILKDDKSQQRTLLLTKEKELHKIEEEMARVRLNFKAKMDRAEKKRQEILKKQQDRHVEMAKFDKFISESEEKQRKAVQCYEEDRKFNSKIDKEYHALCQELTLAMIDRRLIRRRLAYYSEFAKFMQATINILPEDYLEKSDNLFDTLIKRHATLSDTNSFLRINVNSLHDELEEQRSTTSAVLELHTRNVMSQLGSLKEQQSLEDKLRATNKKTEEKRDFRFLVLRKETVSTGNVFRSLDNLANKCALQRPATSGGLGAAATSDNEDNQTIIQKLDSIRDMILNRQWVIKHVLDHGGTYAKTSPYDREDDNADSMARFK